MLQGVISLQVLAIPIIGRLKSSSVNPTSRSMARLGARLGTFPSVEIPRVDALVSRWGLPTRVKRPLSRTKILAAMARDKKTVDGNFRFVVPVGIGRAKVVARMSPDIVVRTLKEIGL